jgi:hypothetical protein
MNKGWSNIDRYGFPEGAKELQDIIEANPRLFGNWNLTNIFKACWRTKDNEDNYDEYKILYFIIRELMRKGESREAIIKIIESYK